MLILFLTILSLSIHHGQAAISAVANVRLNLNSTSIGVLDFYQADPNSNVRITGKLTSLTPNMALGFHVHVNGVNEMTPDCVAAGGHFNPYGTGHGPKEADITQRHVGDLGNITTDANGEVIINMYDGIIQFYNTTQDIANRTIVVHATFDNGGGAGESNVTGMAGSRVACGLIRLTSHAFTLQPTLAALFLAIIIAVFN